MTLRALIGARIGTERLTRLWPLRVGGFGGLVIAAASSPDGKRVAAAGAQPLRSTRRHQWRSRRTAARLAADGMYR